MISVPLHHFVVLLFSGLSLHLLHLNGVRLPPSHVQLVVSHAQRQDALVDPQPRGVKHKVLKETQITHSLALSVTYESFLFVLHQHLLELSCQWV